MEKGIFIQCTTLQHKYDPNDLFHFFSIPRKCNNIKEFRFGLAASGVFGKYTAGNWVKSIIVSRFLSISDDGIRPYIQWVEHIFCPDLMCTLMVFVLLCTNETITHTCTTYLFGWVDVMYQMWMLYNFHVQPFQVHNMYEWNLCRFFFRACLHFLPL